MLEGDAKWSHWQFTNTKSHSRSRATSFFQINKISTYFKPYHEKLKLPIFAHHVPTLRLDRSIQESRTVCFDAFSVGARASHYTFGLTSAFDTNMWCTNVRIKTSVFKNVSNLKSEKKFVQKQILQYQEQLFFDSKLSYGTFAATPGSPKSKLYPYI